MRLEQLGLLEHPHTSAGRVPTDLGYRLYVDRLLHDDEHAGTDAFAVEHVTPDEVRVDTALQATTQALAEATQLLALITAPPTTGAVVRHVEVLLLQPHV